MISTNVLEMTTDIRSLKVGNEVKYDIFDLRGPCGRITIKRLNLSELVFTITFNGFVKTTKLPDFDNTAILSYQVGYLICTASYESNML